MEHILYNPSKVEEIKYHKNLKNHNEAIEYAVNLTHKNLFDTTYPMFNRDNLKRIMEIKPFESESHAINYALVVALSDLERRTNTPSQPKLSGMLGNGMSQKMADFLNKGGHSQENQDPGIEDDTIKYD